MNKTFNYLKREMWDGFSSKEKLFMWGMVLLQILVYIVAPIPGMVWLPVLLVVFLLF